MNSYGNLIQMRILNESLICKQSFYEFVKRAWDSVEQNEFVDGWYIEAICRYFQAVYDGKIKNLIVNQPPRTLKTLISGVMWPAWVWANNPKKKFIFASYAATLSIDASKKCRKLLQSDWYQARFPHVILETAKEDYLTTSKGGHRISIGVDGAGTGRGCDYFIADDILKADDQFSDTVRENANRWFDQTVSTRRDSLKTGVRILICQRLHSQDIVGHVLEKGEKWEQLILPLEYDGIRFQSSIGFVDPRKEIGESLCLERFSTEDIENLKIALGSYATPGQLQQRPTSIEGAIFKEEMFKQRVDNMDIVYRFISIDSAGAVSKSSAYSAFVVGELTSDYKCFIREVYRDKLEFPQLLEVIKMLASKYSYRLEAIFIENKSSGPQAIQSIKQSADEWLSNLIVPVNIGANDGKEARAHSATVWCEASCVLLPPRNPEVYPWLLDFESELFKFPASRYKDQVDAFTMLVNQVSNALEDGLKFRKQKGVI